ncbi:hypothetical protein RCH18_000877 [Flavobacterium sp. PL11]|nr:hypothetical protein [Flavobacterium sp. PL11]
MFMIDSIFKFMQLSHLDLSQKKPLDFSKGFFMLKTV